MGTRWEAGGRIPPAARRGPGGYPAGMRPMSSLSLIATTAWLLASCAGAPVSKVDDGRLAQRRIDDSRCAWESATYSSGAGESPGQQRAAVTLYEQCMR